MKSNKKEREREKKKRKKVPSVDIFICSFYFSKFSGFSSLSYVKALEPEK